MLRPKQLRSLWQQPCRQNKEQPSWMTSQAKKVLFRISTPIPPRCFLRFHLATVFDITSSRRWPLGIDLFTWSPGMIPRNSTL